MKVELKEFILKEEEVMEMDTQTHIFILLVSAIITPVILGVALSKIRSEKLRVVLAVLGVLAYCIFVNIL